MPRPLSAFQAPAWAASLPPETLHHLRPGHRVRRLSRGEVLWPAGQQIAEVAVVNSGLLMFRQAFGSLKGRAFHLVSAGRSLDHQFLQTQEIPFDVVAHKASVVSLAPATNLENMLETTPSGRRLIAHHFFASTLRLLRLRALEAASLDIRLLDTLISVADPHPLPGGAYGIPCLPGQGVLAEVAGSSRSNVSRKLSELEEGGLIAATTVAPYELVVSAAAVQKVKAEFPFIKGSSVNVSHASQLGTP